VRKGSVYRSGRSPDWLKMKNPACAAITREAARSNGETADQMSMALPVAIRAVACPRLHRRCWTARPDLGDRWPSRLVATAAENCLNAQSVHFVCGSQPLPNNRDL
jgi:hypothetical protein